MLVLQVFCVLLCCFECFTKCTDSVECECDEIRRIVACSKQRLEYIPWPSESWSGYYEQLDLFGNVIVDINPNVLELWIGLTSLDLRENPLSETACDMLRDYPQEHPHIIIRSDCFTSPDTLISR